MRLKLWPITLVFCMICHTGLSKPVLTLVSPQPGPSYSATVMENSLAKNILTLVYTQVPADDKDYEWRNRRCKNENGNNNNVDPDTVTYSHPDVEMTTAIIQVKANLDYDVVKTYVCEIVVECNDCEDDDGYKDKLTSTITINVMNVFDIAPTASTNDLNIEIDENSPINTVLKLGNGNDNEVVFTDREMSYSAPQAPDKVTCTLEDMIPASGANLFTVYEGAKYDNDRKIKCKIVTNAALDRETLPTSSYTAKLRATDSGGNFKEVNVQITVNDLNDNPPVCSTSTFLRSIDENGGTLNPPLILTGCVDNDFTTAFQTLKYELASTTVAPYTDFSIGGNTISLTGGPYNYETQNPNPLVMYVYVSDVDTGNTVSATLTVSITIASVNEFPPTEDTWTKTKSLPETAPGGTSIFIPAVTDADKGEGGEIRWSLASATATGGLDVMNEFTIDPVSGEVKLRLGHQLDPTTVSIVMTAKDNNGGLGANSIDLTGTLTITEVNEYPPTITLINHPYTIVEEKRENDTVGSPLQVTDADNTTPAAVITCDITGGNVDNLFRFNPVETLQIELSKRLNIDVGTNHPLYFELIVECVDDGVVPGKLTSTATVTVNVDRLNDNTPTITAPSPIAISEATNAGTTITNSIVVNDNDGPQSPAANAVPESQTECSIKTVTPVGAISNSPFELIGCTTLRLIGPLDRETIDRYYVTVEVKDKGNNPGPLSNTRTIRIDVNDENDNNPICDPALETWDVDENVATTAVIGVVPCTDADIGNPIFTLIANAGPAPFTINANGQVRFTTSPNYETDTFFSFKVEATDNADPSKKSSVQIHVNVKPVNEFTPDFTPAPSTHSIPEDTPSGTVMSTTFLAVDADLGGHEIIRYEKVTVDPIAGLNLFQVSNTGVITLMGPLNYESMSAPYQYKITVRAIDGGNPQLQSTGDFTITVTDVNDNIPTCDKPVFVCTMPENAAAGDACAGDPAQGTDLDTSATFNTMTYSIQAGDPAPSIFQIVSGTGVVQRAATGTLNYENLHPAGAYYNLTIRATDGTNHVDCPMRIHVTDVEEGPPVFGPNMYNSPPFLENSAVGATVYTPTVTHVDKWQKITYSLGAANDFFIVNSDTGVITLKKQVDMEVQQVHTFSVIANDGTSTDTLAVTINIGDYNEFVPFCNPGSITTTPTEDTASVPVTRILTTLSCTDDDSTDNLLFTIASVKEETTNVAQTTHPFTIVGNGLNTKTPWLDYDIDPKNYIVEIEVNDQQTTPSSLKTTATVTVSVQPENEHAPAIQTCQNSITAGPCTGTDGTDFSIPENTAKNTEVAQMNANDADKGSNHDLVTWSIISGNTLGYFKLESNSGKLIIEKPPDREISGDTITLKIRATDGGGLFDQKDSIITITDKNDNPPIFTPNFYDLQISEAVASPATLIVFDSTKITDGDSATNDNNVVTLSIPSVIPASKASDWTIVLNGANYELRTTTTLDYSACSQYNLVIRAIDGHTLSEPKKTTDINVVVRVLDDNAGTPVFSALTNPMDVAENEVVGSAIATVRATDVDAANTFSGTLTYEIFNGNTNNDFSIENVATGSAYDANIRIRNALDRETAPLVYYLGVRVSDSGSPTVKTATMTLTVTVTDINDNTPTFSGPFSYTINENLAVGPAGITIGAADLDQGVNQAITYSIVSQSFTGPDGATDLFEIDSSSGVVSLKQIPDREYHSSYDLMIKIEDGGNPKLSTQRIFTIGIQDENDNFPVFAAMKQVLSVDEERPANTPVTSPVSLLATDKDTGPFGTITYSLESADGGTSDASHFKVDVNANIFTNQANLDRETFGYYKLRLVATDGGAPPKVTKLDIEIALNDINDNDPVLTVSSPNTIYENAAGGTFAAKVTGTDADDGPLFNKLTYSITGGQPTQLFVINDLGDINLFESNTLDREGTASYTLTVQCVDGGTPGLDQRMSTISVPITVLDVNDNTPTFPAGEQVRTIPEMSAVDTDVGLPVTATDLDNGANQTMTYTIMDVLVPTTGGMDHFKVDTLTGQIKVKTGGVIDRELYSSYILRYVAIDNGTPTKRTGTTSIKIMVTDVNDNAPKFVSNYTTGVSVVENSAIGTEVTTISATDVDLNSGGVVQYAMDTTSLQGSTADTYFNVDVNTGKISVKAPIDREQYDSLNFNVKAVDQGTPRLTGYATVIISVQDENDNTPQFDQSFYNIETDYQDKRAVELVTVRATDADKTGNSVTYYWATAASRFDLNTFTGSVRSKNEIQTTNGQINDLTIRGVDAGTPSKENTAQLRIDGFDFSKVGVCIDLKVSEAKLLSYRSQLVSGLHNSIASTRDPTNMPRLWKSEVISDSESRAFIYVVDSNKTNEASFINTPKTYITRDTLFGLWRKTEYGDCSNTLQNGMPNGVVAVKITDCTVEPAPVTNATVTEVPFAATAAGIATIVTAAVLGTVLVTSLAAFAIYKCCGSGAGAVPPIKNLQNQPVQNITKPNPAYQQPPQRQLPGPRANTNEIFRDNYGKHEDRKNTWRGTPEPEKFKNKPGRLSPGRLETTGLNNQYPGTPAFGRY